MELTESVWNLHDTASSFVVERPILRGESIKSLVIRHRRTEHQDIPTLPAWPLPPGEHQ